MRSTAETIRSQSLRADQGGSQAEGHVQCDDRHHARSAVRESRNPSVLIRAIPRRCLRKTASQVRSVCRNPSVLIREIPSRTRISQQGEAHEGRNPSVRIRAVPRTTSTSAGTSRRSRRCRNPSVRIRAVPSSSTASSSRESSRRKSQSLRTDQACSESWPELVEENPWLEGRRNPSVRIRAVPSAPGEIILASSANSNVAIPPYGSGLFRGCRYNLYPKGGVLEKEGDSRNPSVRIRAVPRPVREPVGGLPPDLSESQSLRTDQGCSEGNSSKSRVLRCLPCLRI